MGTRLPEYHIVPAPKEKGWIIIDEWGEEHWPARVYSTYREALREAGKMHAEDLADYDGPPDGEEWSGGFADNH